MSFGGSEKSKILEDALQMAYENNILIFAAAGNDGKISTDTILYPAKYKQVVAVGAIDKSEERAEFSSVGSDLELVAPGVDINSTLSNGTYGNKSGTSMAAPHATGVAALLWSKDANLTNQNIRDLLDQSAIGLGENNLYGNGLVNAKFALDFYNDFDLKGKKGKIPKNKKNKFPESNTLKKSVDPSVIVASTIEAYDLETSHPYPNNISYNWRIFPAANNATNIRVHFQYIETEMDFDYVTTSAGDSWHGSYPSGVWSSWSGGSYIDVFLTTDGSVTFNGFRIDQIEYTTASGTIEAYDLETVHPYPNNISYNWRIFPAANNASNVRVHFQYIETEANYDFVTTSGGDNWSGSYPSGVWSKWSGSSYIDVFLTTDGSVTRNGFRIDQIEYIPNVTDDFGNNMSLAKSIQAGTTYYGNINYAGDVDFFKFKPTVSGNYVIASSGSTDTYGYLYNSSGSELASNDDSNGTLNFTISYNLTADQIYYIKVRHYSSGTGAYGLTVSAPVATDDYGNTMSTATTLQFNSSRTGNIDYAGDVDFFKFIPAVSRSFVFKTTGSTDTYGYLYDSNGIQINENDDYGSLNFTMTQYLTANQTYYLKVRHYSSSSTGSYSVIVTDPILGDESYVLSYTVPQDQARVALDHIMTDIDNYGSQLDNFDSNNTLSFNSLVSNIVKLIGSVQDRVMHFNRNKINRAPSFLQEMEDYIKANPGQKWRMLPVSESLFHMNDGEVYNIKFVSPDEHFEAVYNTQTKLLVTNSSNMGTYNFVGPSDKTNHEIYDVNPYFQFGNTEDQQLNRSLDEGRAVEVAKAAANSLLFYANLIATSWFDYYYNLYK